MHSTSVLGATPRDLAYKSTEDLQAPPTALLELRVSIGFADPRHLEHLSAYSGHCLAARALPECGGTCRAA